MVNLEVAGIVGVDRFALEAKGKRDHLRPGEEASAALEHSAPRSRVIPVATFHIVTNVKSQLLLLSKGCDRRSAGQHDSVNAV